MKTSNEINDDLTYRIIGCAMKVHGVLGNGFQEVIYQRALAIAMKKEALAFEREMVMPIFFENEKIGSRRVDFFSTPRLSDHFFTFYN